MKSLLKVIEGRVDMYSALDSCVLDKTTIFGE